MTEDSSMNAGAMPDPDQTVNAAEGAQSSARRKRILAIVGLVITLVALTLWFRGRNLESTDDAYVQADILKISPRVVGTVLALHVEENEAVAAGDVLIDLDPAEFQARFEQAQANFQAAQAGLESARADLTLTDERTAALIEQAEAGLLSAEAEEERAQLDLTRYQGLIAKNEISQQVLDQAQAVARSATARVAELRARLREALTAPQQIELKQVMVSSREAEVVQAQAALEQARLNLSYTHITAPAAGRVTRKNVLPGSQVQPGMPVLALVGDQPWVVANFKETQIGEMQPGQKVRMHVDAYPNADFTGYVDSIQSGTGSVFSLLPPENATGNFVKVVQRVPVKLRFDPAPGPEHRLLPGMSVVPTVDLASRRDMTATVATN